jgi:protein TonB
MIVGADARHRLLASTPTAQEWQQRAADLAPKPSTSATAIPEAARIGGVLGAIIGGVSPGQPIVSTPEEAEKRLIKKTEPDYPPSAKRDGLQGDIVLMVTIGLNGHVESSRFVSGPPLFLPAAQEAVSKWVYKPMMVDGQARKWTTNVQVRFVLP